MTPAATTDRRFIDFVHANRATVGLVLIALAVVCVAVAAYCGYRGLGDAFRQPDAVAADPANPPPPEADAPRELEPAPWRMGLIAALIAALGLGGTGAFFVGKLPPADEARRLRTDRVLVLIAGYVFGLANRLCGLALFVIWFGKLTDWVSGKADSQKTGWLPVAALLQFLLGAGVTFLAAVPARAEERNNTWIRRAVYAVNFALTAVLLVVGLVLVNAVVAMKLPDKLDTTSTGFYTLTDQTRSYVGGLKQPVRVYAITSDVGGNSRLQRWQTDALRLLAACREANPQKFEVVEYSAVSDKKKIEDLQQNYPAANLREFGVLVTAGEKRPGSDYLERSEYVEFERMTGRAAGGEGKPVFVGEAKLIRAVMFLTEKRATAYFTQMSREPFVDPPTDPTAVAAGRSALRLKDVLEASQCTVKTWTVDPLAADAKVPDDADLVVVLDPLGPLPQSAVAALRRYLAPADQKAKKGRLIVFTSAQPDGDKLARTGLEPLLEDYGIVLFDRQIYAMPTESVGADLLTVGPMPSEVKQRNPLALAVASNPRTRNVRVVQPTEGGGRARLGGGRTVTVAADARITWLETKRFAPPRKAWDDLDRAARQGDQQYAAERQVARGGAPWSVGMYALDNADSKPAVAVFGFAEGLTDDTADADGGRAGVLLSAGVNWLRERPPEPDIAPKQYVDYIPRKGVSEAQLVYLPVAGTLLVIVLLGLGVWAVRRK